MLMASAAENVLLSSLKVHCLADSHFVQTITLRFALLLRIAPIRDVRHTSRRECARTSDLGVRWRWAISINLRFRFNRDKGMKYTFTCIFAIIQQEEKVSISWCLLLWNLTKIFKLWVQQQKYLWRSFRKEFLFTFVGVYSGSELRVRQ
jgi:hypothetical protein